MRSPQSKCEMNMYVLTSVPLNFDKKRRRGETEAEALICFCWLERQSVDSRECSWPQQTDPHKHFEFSNNPTGHQVQDHLVQQTRSFLFSEYLRIFKQYENNIYMYYSATNTRSLAPVVKVSRADIVESTLNVCHWADRITFQTPQCKETIQTCK